MLDQNNLKEITTDAINEHRTVQQCFMREVVMPFLRAKAEDYKKKRFDARNEGTCETASKMLAALDDGDYYLPYI